MLQKAIQEQDTQDSANDEEDNKAALKEDKRAESDSARDPKAKAEGKPKAGGKGKAKAKANAKTGGDDDVKVNERKATQKAQQVTYKYHKAMSETNAMQAAI